MDVFTFLDNADVWFEAHPVAGYVAAIGFILVFIGWLFKNE